MRIRVIVDGKRTVAFAARRACKVLGCGWTFEARVAKPTAATRRVVTQTASRAALAHKLNAHRAPMSKGPASR